jgi:hypothetical protein
VLALTPVARVQFDPLFVEYIKLYPTASHNPAPLVATAFKKVVVLGILGESVCVQVSPLDEYAINPVPEPTPTQNPVLAS